MRLVLEFDFRVVGDGRSAVARYANNSNYRNDSLIRKESMPSLPNKCRCSIYLGSPILTDNTLASSVCELPCH